MCWVWGSLRMLVGLFSVKVSRVVLASRSLGSRYSLCLNNQIRPKEAIGK